MKKTYVLDTSVFIHDPEATRRFGDNYLIIPLAVIEELDGLKKGHGEVSWSARKALKTIDALLRNAEPGGCALPQGGSVSIGLDGVSGNGTARTADDRIINTAVKAKSSFKGRVLLVSKDTAMRVKALSIGMEAEDYRNDKTLFFEGAGKVLSGWKPEEGGIRSVRYMVDGKRLVRVTGYGEQAAVARTKGVSGISPRSIEQECALDALISKEIEVVALTGKAGTGKTLLAIAAGIHLVEARRHDQLMVSRPIAPMGSDIGYLPGEVEDKLRPWMQPIFDNLEIIMKTPNNGKGGRKGSGYKNYQYLLDAGLMQIEPLTYIRGRSLPGRFLIVDESQNLRPLDVKTILTRAGEGTKVVFTGDLDQVDTPYLDVRSNGLAYLISRFINEESFFYMDFTRCVRSDLADRAAKLL